ncbi:MAG: hypothetical protein OEP45_11940, partial [Acidobacteriota bacterium]|nr:hypothetical protein [Acidobacteriota bacterium]
SVQAHRYAADGAPQGDQFQVNSYTADSQYFPAVGPDGSGGFVVAWTSYGSDGGDTDDFGIRAQRFAADGTPQGGEFQVNSYTSSRQIYPAIGPDGDGGFVVVWQSEGSGGDDTEGWSVQGRRFAADGTPLGDDFQVNTYTPGAQERPDVAADGAGGFVVVWQSEGSGGDDTEGWSVQAQRFGADGQPTGGELQVNAYTTSDQRLPAVHPDGLGGFVVAWQSDGSNGNDTSQESIQARRYATDGSPPGPELQVNAFTSLGQLLPTIGPWGEDRFVIAWTSEANVGDNDPEDVRSQRFFSGLFTDGFESGDTSAWSLSHPPPGIPAPVPRRVTPGNSG